MDNLVSISFVADWYEIWTKEEAEEELSFQGFKFDGPGWYNFKNDWMLVIPVRREEDETWKTKKEKGEKFRFLVWEGYDPTPSFRKILEAPVRHATL